MTHYVQFKAQSSRLKTQSNILLRKNRPFKFPNSYIYILLAIVLITSCAHIGTPVQPGRFYKASEDWSRHEKLYQGLDMALDAWVLYENLNVRKAFVEDYCKLYMIDEAKKEGMWTKELANNEKYIAFTVIISADYDEWADLLGENGMWKVYLSTGKNTLLEPIEVKGESWSESLKRFYPSLSHWNKIFRIRFLKDELNLAPGRKDIFLKLIFTGPLGRLELRWPYTTE